MKIEIDTTQPLSEQDKAALRGLLGDNPPSSTVTEAPKKRTAKKAAAAPAADFPTDAERAEAPPASEGVVPDKPVEEPDPDLKSAAIARAAELLSGDGRERVMAALKAAGANRVSEVTAEALPGFMAALTD